MKPSQADRSQDRHPGSATTEELRNGAADADFRSKAAQGPCGQLGSNGGGGDSWIRAQVLVSRFTSFRGCLLIQLPPKSEFCSRHGPTQQRGVSKPLGQRVGNHDVPWDPVCGHIQQLGGRVDDRNIDLGSSVLTGIS